jgi:FAD:protein FMN transferase
MAIDSTKIRRARPLLGTFVEIEAAGAAEADLAVAIDAAFEAVATVHNLMSFHRADSDVSRLNREAHLRAISVHPWTFQVIETAIELHRRSNGVFDIAIAPALQRLGLLPGTYQNSPPDAAHSLDAIELLADSAIRFRRAAGIDLGGIAKGFAVDCALDALRRCGIPSGLVNAGGDFAAFGTASQVIHIRHPRDPAELVCAVEIFGEALASSARRVDPFLAAETHSTAVIDPTTQEPARSIDGVTVRAPSCMIADALTKVVMIRGTGAGDLLAHYGARALMILRDGEILITSDWHRAGHLAA